MDQYESCVCLMEDCMDTKKLSDKQHEPQTMEKETQQPESLSHCLVPPKSDTFPGGTQPPDQRIKRFLQIFDQFKPRILWVILVIIAVYNYFHPSDVFGLLVLIAVAEGSLSIPQTLELLLNKWIPMRMPPPLEEQQAGGQPGGQASDEQNEPE